jgi:hypothetical protein
MSDVPQYPAGHSASSESSDQLAPRSRRAVYAGASLVLLAVMVVVALHLTGVLGPAGH